MTATERAELKALVDFAVRCRESDRLDHLGDAQVDSALARAFPDYERPDERDTPGAWMPQSNPSLRPRFEYRRFPLGHTLGVRN